MSQRPADPAEWPYADLHLACPHCPVCGWAASMMIAPNVHPMAFCANDDCRVFQYDPTQPAVQVLLGASVVVEEQHADGTILWRAVDGSDR
ncbi:hypothetical protein [Nocardioides pakistanensis]